MDHPIILTKLGERIFDLRWKMSYTSDFCERPRFSGPQPGEYVILPDGFPSAGEILRIMAVERLNRHDWHYVLYVNTGIKGPSGWQRGEPIRLVVSYNHTRFIGLQAKRTHEFISAPNGVWGFKEAVELYDKTVQNIFNTEIADTLLENETNPYSEGSIEHLAWEHIWPDLVREWREEHPEEEDLDIDDEYHERMMMVRHVSEVCGGLTSEEVRNILYDC